MRRVASNMCSAMRGGFGHHALRMSLRSLSCSVPFPAARHYPIWSAGSSVRCRAPAFDECRAQNNLSTHCRGAFDARAFGRQTRSVSMALSDRRQAGPWSDPGRGIAKLRHFCSLCARACRAVVVHCKAWVCLAPIWRVNTPPTVLTPGVYTKFGPELGKTASIAGEGHRLVVELR